MVAFLPVLNYYRPLFDLRITRGQFWQLTKHFGDDVYKMEGIMSMFSIILDLLNILGTTQLVKQNIQIKDNTLTLMFD